MTHQEKLDDIQQHPEQHRHNFWELQACCFINGALSMALIAAHQDMSTVFPNRHFGGTKCDVEFGPCSCGSWHNEEV